MTRFAFSIPTADAAEQRQLFASYRRAGFEGLQLKGGQYLPWLDDPAGFQAQWGRDPALISGLIFGGSLDEDGQEALHRVIKFAAAVGSERVIFCHGRSHSGLTPDDLRRYAQILSEIGQEARRQGVALSLHHHYDQPVMQLEDLRVFYASITEGAVGLTLDTAHLAKSGIWEIAAVAREYAAVLDNVHMKDYAAGKFVPLGQGQVNFVPLVQTLRRIGYDGWLCADEESGGGVEAGMRAAQAFLAVHWPEEFHADHTR